jgi:hypothetical protein
MIQPSASTNYSSKHPSKLSISSHLTAITSVAGVDTIRTRHQAPLSENALKDWNRFQADFPSGFASEKYFIKRTMPNGCEVRLNYHVKGIDRDSASFIDVEYSLPRLLYGNNLVMKDKLDETLIAKITEIFSHDPILSVLDPGQGLITRIDLFCNYQVGDLMSGYLVYLNNMYFPRRTRGAFSNSGEYSQTRKYPNGVQFVAKKIHSTFYAKDVESGNPEAAGILRQEISLREPQRIIEIFGENPTLRSISLKPARDLLEKDLHTLALDKPVLISRDQARKALIDKYGPRHGLTLYGFLMVQASHMHYDDVRIAKALEKSVKCIRGMRRDITNAGIAPSLAITRVPLPPLKING